MATEILRPNAAGDLTELDQWPMSGNNYDKVDEETPDENDTYVENSNPGFDRDLYNLTNSVIGAGTITKVTVHVRCQAESGG